MIGTKVTTAHLQDVNAAALDALCKVLFNFSIAIAMKSNRIQVNMTIYVGKLYVAMRHLQLKVFTR